MVRYKKSRFWIFVFSLFPGAGQMYLGFMRRGVSLMGLFFLVIFLSSWLSIGPLMYLLPVLWFFAFFDGINRGYADDETFARFEDGWLFPAGRLPGGGRDLPWKGRLAVGILALLLGVYLIWNNLLSALARVLPEAFYRALADLTQMAPQLIVGVLIIAAGVWLLAAGGNRNGGDGHD
jgi:TM2 domain-containing membrane protein YozV